MKVIEAMKEHKIRNFYDILTALREHPEWLEEIRRLVLTDELLNLPRKFDEFVKNEFRPLVKRVDRIEKDVQVLKQDVEVLKQDVKVLKQDVEGLKQDVEGLKQDVKVLKQDVKVLKQDVGKLKGDNLERKVRDKAPAYFGRFLRRIRLIDHNKLADMLDDAIEKGIVSDEDRLQLLQVDGVLKGKLGKDGREVWVVFEVSHVVDEHDVKRAQERARILEKIAGKTVLAAVIGEKFVVPKKEVEERGVLAIPTSM